MKPTYEIDGVWYHGGKAADISEIAANKINTTSGGGELGLGFYIGNYGHEASAWARHKNRNDAVVVQLTISNFTASGLKKLELSRILAVEHWIKIKQAGHQRKFQFSRDVIAAPIVGKMFKDSPIQLKWEGVQSKTYLNSTDITTKITTL